MTRFNLGLGKIFGIPVYIHWSWWIFLILQACISLEYLPVMVVFFVIVLMHEYGHCFAAKYFGIKVDSIVLHIMGGLAWVEGKRQTPKEEFWIILWGPLVNFFLAFPLYFLSEGSLFFFRLFVLNVGMLIFNLLPVFPLDGAKICRSILTAVTGNHRLSTMVFVWITKAVAVIFGILSLFVPVMYPNAPFIGWLMILAVIMWIQAEQEIKRLPPLPELYQVHDTTQESLSILQQARQDVGDFRRKYNR
jgi:Zn-dependent protease